MPAPPEGHALSVTFGDSSPKGGASGVPVRPTRDEQSLIFSGTVVLRCLGQRQLDKARLSRSRCPRKQGPPFCAISGLRRPVESGPACQWLPLWGSWRAKARLRGQARRERTAHAAISRLFVSAMLSLRPQITVSILALSVTFGDSSPKGGASGVPVRPTRDEQSLIFSGTVVLRCLGQRQLDKARLSRSRCPRKQGPPFCAISGLRRPVESGPACQWLPLWGSWRAKARLRGLFCKTPLQTSPRCGIIYLAASPLRIEYLPL